MKRTIVGLAIAAALLAAAPASADTANGFTVTTTGLNQYNKLHLGSCFDHPSGHAVVCGKCERAIQ